MQDTAQGVEQLIKHYRYRTLPRRRAVHTSVWVQDTSQGVEQFIKQCRYRILPRE
jgi:hypothetical protein